MFNEDLLRAAGFSEKAVKFITGGRNYGKMNDATVQGFHTGTCRDTIIIYLKIEGDTIRDASFVYSGCAGSAAAGSAVTEIVKGKTIDEASKLTLQDIVDFYKEGDKGLPAVKHECGGIAVSALKDALKNYTKTHETGQNNLTPRRERISFASDEDKGLESTLAHHFGRCRYYIFVDVENGEIKNIETKENPYFESHEPGVVPRFIAEQKADVIVAGGMGPRAIEWFEKLNVKPITTTPKRIKDILESYLKGHLSGAESCDDSH